MLFLDVVYTSFGKRKMALEIMAWTKAWKIYSLKCAYCIVITLYKIIAASRSVRSDSLRTF